jgi:hypothetical protein
VSLPWRDDVAIYLAPHRLALVRRAGGLRRRVVAEAEVAVPLGDAGDPGPALARLAELVAGRAWRGAAARAVVADHPWARYAVVPWPATRLDAAGRLAHARYVLGDTYGEGVADWTVTLADTPPGLPYVACATPPALRAALEDALAPARIRLVSLQPQLVAAFNAWRRRLPAGDAWFVSVGDGFLSAVYLRRGAWERVLTARLPPDWGAELERLQALARVTWGAGAPGRMLVDAPAWMGRAAAPGAGIEWLEQGARVPPRARALALLRGARA